MNAEPYLQFAGVEIANSNRTLTYVRRGLANSAFSVGLKDTLLPGDPFQPGNLAVYCAATSDPSYDSPALDGAPWYDGSAAAGEFLGLYAHGVNVLSVVNRSITSKIAGGGVLGGYHPKYRVVDVSAYMFAGSVRGMKYGERWLEQILAGTITGCPQDELRILPECDGAFQTLYEAGIVSDINYAPVGIVPQCYMQLVSWQMASSYSAFLGDLDAILAPTTITNAAPVCGSLVGDASGARTAGVLTIFAGSGSGITDLHIVGEPTGGYSDTYADSYEDYSGGGYYVDYEVDSMPEGYTLIIDGAREIVQLLNAGGAVVGGMEVLNIRGPFQWPVVWGGSTMRLCVNSPGGTLNGDTTLQIDGRVMA